MASKAPVDLSVDSASINSSAVTVNADAVAAALQALHDASSTERHRLMVVLPLKWDNLEQEATFHMLLHILNITSGAQVCACRPAFVRPRAFFLLLAIFHKNLMRRNCRPEATSLIAIWLVLERLSSWVF
jgi:hypothetical protein